MNIGAAISKPFSNIKNLVIGIVLMFIPIVNVLTIPGYVLRLARKTMKKDHSLPGFENFGELVVDSLKAIVVGIVYAIIFAIVTLVLAFIPFIGWALAVLWNIAVLFIALSAMMTLARTGSIGAALGVPDVVKRAANLDFIIAVVVGAVIMAIVLAVVLVIVGVLFGASLLPVILTGGSDPTAAMAAIVGMLSTMAVGVIVVGIVAYILEVFFYSLAAEAYPA